MLARLIAAAGPYRLKPETRDSSPFRHLARAIAHQQLNGTAANTILRRFAALYGHVDTGGAAHGAVEPPFPTPQQVIDTPDATLRGTGFSFAKVAALKDLSVKALSGIVPDTRTLESLDDDAIVERLTQVRGIGRWTVEMMLMFQLGRPDVLPIDDFGVRNGFRLTYGLRAMPTPRGLAVFGERWAPFRTAAAWYLWRAVDLARTGTLPPPLRPAPRVPAVKPRKAKSRKAARAAPRKRAR